MTDQSDKPEAENPAATGGATGLQGGYGSDTGFASDQAQGKSGQVGADGSPRGQIKDSSDGDDLSIDDVDGDPNGAGPSSASASDQRAGSSTGGSSSGAEPRFNPDDRLRDERHEAVPNGGTAAMVAADVTEDLGVLGADESDISGESRTFAGGGGGSGLQSGGHMTQPGTMMKQTATNEREDSGDFDRSESHMGTNRNPEQSGRGPQANHPKGSF
jgi:hypothetical protein